MPTAWLNVPHLLQNNDGYCLPACASMVLAYWQNPISQEKIAILLDATQQGVPGSRIRRLENWGYQITYRPATLAELQTWIEQGIPPIVLVDTDFLEYWDVGTPHAVVVIGFDDSFIYLNDPAFATAPQQTSLDGFLAAWTEMDDIVAVIERIE